MLRSMEIVGFRAFGHLTAHNLGRVNLIVGKNNVGKTMFLEALRLHALGGVPRAIRSLLIERDEIQTETVQGDEELPEVQLRVASLFHHKPGHNGVASEIRIGELNQPSQQLIIRRRWLRRMRDRQGSTVRYEIIDGSYYASADPSIHPGLEVKSENSETIFPIAVLNGVRPRIALREPTPEVAFVSARGVSEREIARWWDVVALRDGESRVTECMRLITPVERMTLVEHPYRPGERIALVKLENESQPVPLKSLGDGVGRIFQIALAMENARSSRWDNGETQGMFFPEITATPRLNTPLLLVDEMENGIHYSVHAQFWKFILLMAVKNDVQVFATSHSWDCICGLREALVDVPDADVALLRLERKSGEHKAIHFKSQELDIITRDDIEVR